MSRPNASPAADLRELAGASLRAGIAAGLAMIPFAAVFRARGLRINEYGRKTMELLVGPTEPPLEQILSFVQHMAISIGAAWPLLLFLRRIDGRATRVAIGAAYGTGFYVAVNSLALPALFGDPTPWQLGFATVYPSLVVHLVYGVVLALLAPATARR